jgi:hypothetical protein
VRLISDESWSDSLCQTFFVSCVGGNIPDLTELPLSTCGSRKFQIYPPGTTSVLVPPTRVYRSLDTTGWLIIDWLPRECGGPVPLVLDLRITHDRFGSSSDPSINGHLHYPNNVDRSLNESVVDKIRQYRVDYNNRPSNVIFFMTDI